LSPDDVLDLLSHLVDRSLVQVAEPGAGMEHGCHAAESFDAECIAELA
jgi:hypothetical protein